jgi:hypothetical protein
VIEAVHDNYGIVDDYCIFIGTQKKQPRDHVGGMNGIFVLNKKIVLSDIF